MRRAPAPGQGKHSARSQSRPPRLRASLPGTPGRATPSSFTWAAPSALRCLSHSSQSISYPAHPARPCIRDTAAASGRRPENRGHSPPFSGRRLSGDEREPSLIPPHTAPWPMSLRLLGAQSAHAACRRGRAWSRRGGCSCSAVRPRPRPCRLLERRKVQAIGCAPSKAVVQGTAAVVQGTAATRTQSREASPLARRPRGRRSFNIDPKLTPKLTTSMTPS